MSLHLIKALDGEDIGEHLVRDLNGHCKEIIKETIEEAIDNSTRGNTRIAVILVTPLMLQSINDHQDIEIRKLHGHFDNIIYLYQCRSAEDKHKVIKRIERATENRAIVEHIDLIKEDDFDIAELKVRKMLRLAKKEDTARPVVKKFILTPETITQNTKDVKLVILEDGNTYSNIKVEISENPGKISRLRDGVWMMNTAELKPGAHTIKVLADETDLGSAVLNVASRTDVLFDLLPLVVKETPVEFLCRLFNLDENQFDAEMLDLVDDNTENCVFLHKCLDRLLDFGGEFPTSLHFGAKHSLDLTCKRVLNRRYGTECMRITDKSGKTPYDLAVDTGSEYMMRILKHDDDEIEPLPSPLRKTSTGGHVTPRHVRDSGNSSSGSSGSQSAHSSGGTVPKVDSRGRLASDGESVRETIAFEQKAQGPKITPQLLVGRAPHHYEEIDKGPDKPLLRKKTHTYNQPWDNNDHLTFVMSMEKPKLKDTRQDSTDL